MKSVSEVVEEEKEAGRRISFLNSFRARDRERERERERACVVNKC